MSLSPSGRVRRTCLKSGETERRRGPRSCVAGGSAPEVIRFGNPRSVSARAQRPGLRLEFHFEGQRERRGHLPTQVNKRLL